MITRILFKLVSLLAREAPREVPHPWFVEDRHWYGSSFELARGLEVIEHCGAAPVFADTMPTLRPPGA